MGSLGLASLEFFYPTHGVDVFHFASEKGMAGAAKLHVDVFFGGAGGKRVAARAGNDGVVIVGRMESGFHGYMQSLMVIYSH